MKLVLQPTCDNDSFKIIMSYLDFIGDRYDILNKNDLEKVVLGIISIPEKGKMFNGIEPTISFKNKRWAAGLYLDNNYILSNPPMEELDRYIRQSICKRMEELKKYKTLRGIKDRTMFDDIAKLFS